MGKNKYLEIKLETDELHRRIGRGIPAGSFVIIEGEHAYGKSILAQRLSYGFLENASSVTYISSEMTTNNFVEQMDSLGYGITDYLTERNLLFIPLFPQVGRVIPRGDFINRLMKADSLFSNQALVVDTLDSLVDENLSKEDLFNLISFIKKVIDMKKTIIATVDPGNVDQSLMKKLRSISDIYFSLRMKEVGGSIKRMINVYRFRGSSITVADTVGFKVEPGVGFVIEISSLA